MPIHFYNAISKLLLCIDRLYLLMCQLPACFDPILDRVQVLIFLICVSQTVFLGDAVPWLCTQVAGLSSVHLGERSPYQSKSCQGAAVLSLSLFEV